MSFECGPPDWTRTKHLLLRDGEPVLLIPKVFETLLVLVESNGHLVEPLKVRDSIAERVARDWPSVG